MLRFARAHGGLMAIPGLLLLALAACRPDVPMVKIKLVNECEIPFVVGVYDVRDIREVQQEFVRTFPNEEPPVKYLSSTGLTHLELFLVPRPVDTFAQTPRVLNNVPLGDLLSEEPGEYTFLINGELCTIPEQAGQVWEWEERDPTATVFTLREDV